MIPIRYLPVVAKQVIRHRIRSILTVAGIALAMFLLVLVQALNAGVRNATEVKAGDRTLVVYRANRFCPSTSRLPHHFQSRIAKLTGVQSVVPIKIVVSNCAASLDVVTFRGIPDSELPKLSGPWELMQGSPEQWLRRSDAVMVGERLAARKKLRAGDAFSSAGVTVTVAGIYRSPRSQEQEAAYAHLDFLQQTRSAAEIGTVTQFNVTVSEGAELSAVAKTIDNEFRFEAEPTQTSPERAFVAQAGSDIVEIVRFTRYVGWACLAMILALISNAIVLSVQGRVREHAVLQALGYRGSLIARLIISEGAVLGAAGGMIGGIASSIILLQGEFSLHNEGTSIPIEGDLGMTLAGLGLACGAGILAGVVPAIQAGRRSIAESFRAV